MGRENKLKFYGNHFNSKGDIPEQLAPYSAQAVRTGISPGKLAFFKKLIATEFFFATMHFYEVPRPTY